MNELIKKLIKEDIKEFEFNNPNLAFKFNGKRYTISELRDLSETKKKQKAKLRKEYRSLENKNE